MLARVNDSQDAVSESSRGSDDSRGLLTGDLCTSGFGDNIYVKNNNTLRIGFQNVGGFPTQLGNIYITEIYFTMYYPKGEPIGASQPRVARFGLL